MVTDREKQIISNFNKKIALLKKEINDGQNNKNSHWYTLFVLHGGKSGSSPFHSKPNPTKVAKASLYADNVTNLHIKSVTKERDAFQEKINVRETKIIEDEKDTLDALKEVAKKESEAIEKAKELAKETKKNNVEKKKYNINQGNKVLPKKSNNSLIFIAVIMYFVLTNKKKR